MSARGTRGTQANLGFAGRSRGKQGKAREWDEAGAAGKQAKAGENKESKGTQRKGEESRRKQGKAWESRGEQGKESWESKGKQEKARESRRKQEKKEKRGKVKESTGTNSPKIAKKLRGVLEITKAGARK